MSLNMQNVIPHRCPECGDRIQGRRMVIDEKAQPGGVTLTFWGTCNGLFCNWAANIQIQQGTGHARIDRDELLEAGDWLMSCFESVEVEES